MSANREQCLVCRERPIEHPRSGECHRCYLRRWNAARPGYSAMMTRGARLNPSRAERDREASRRWKEQNRDRNRARDRVYQARKRADSAR